MNYSDYRFTLDITNTLQAQVSVPCTFGDSARKLYIGLTEGRKPYTINNGCRAQFVGKKPDGTVIYNDCIIEGNKTIVYEFSKNTASAEGVVDCEIRLIGTNGRTITSPQFIIVVDKRVLRDEEIISESDRGTLDNIILTEEERVRAENERVKAEAERNAAFEEIKKIYGTNGSIYLPMSGWVDNAQSVTIPDVDTNDFIMFYPATEEDNYTVMMYHLYCEAEAMEGVVNFHVLDTPTSEVVLKYYVNRSIGGGE